MQKAPRFFCVRILLPLFLIPPYFFGNLLKMIYQLIVNGKEIIKILEKERWWLKKIVESNYQMEKDGKKVPVPVHGNRDIP